jgi:nitrate reductase NapAB chaperone NapD
MEKLHIVHLKKQEREDLTQYLCKGESSAISMKQAGMLLLADKKPDDDEITETLNSICSIDKVIV